MSISPSRIALVAGGGALLAAWLTAATTAPRDAVAEFVPQPPPVAQREGPAPDGGVDAGLGAGIERLRLLAADGPVLRVGVRNPFSLAPPPPPSLAGTSDPSPERRPRTVSGLPRRVGPRHKLIGVASRRTEDGSQRTGILTAPNGEVQLVRVGDRVAGGYRVDAVEASSVTLVDDGGTRHRLDLP